MSAAPQTARPGAPAAARAGGRLGLAMGDRSQVLRFGAHLAVLWGFAIVQPLLHLLGDNAEFFVARGAPGGDIVAFAVGLTVGPPLVLWLFELLVGGVAGARARLGAHLAFTAALAALLVLQFAKRLGGDTAPWLLIAASVLVGVALAAAYWRASEVRSFLSVLSPAPVLFLALFLFFSPVNKLAFGSSDESRASVAKASTPVSGGRVPIVFLQLDEFPIASALDRHHRIDHVRFPNLARLAGDSMWFPNTITVSDGTPTAVPAILTGNRPRKGRYGRYADQKVNLFTLFARSHRLFVDEAVTRLCPTSLCASNRDARAFSGRMSSLTSDLALVSAHMVLPDRMEDDLAPVDESWGDFGNSGDSDAVTARSPGRASAATKRRPAARPAGSLTAATHGRAQRFARFLDRMHPWTSGRPPLHFIHILLPHVPWEYLPSGRVYGGGDPAPGLHGTRWAPDQALVDHDYQRHLLQLEYTDRKIGEMVARLKRAGLYDRALVVVTADHGASFTAGGPRRSVRASDVEDIGPVPFVLKAPGQHRGRVERTYLQTIDELPTILDVLGARSPARMDGRPARVRARRPLRSVTTLSTPSFKRHTTSIGAMNRLRATALRFKLRRFGDHGRSLYRIGPVRGLIGRSVASLHAPRVAGTRVSFDRAGDMRHYAPSSGYSPSHLSGVLHGVPGDAAVAFAVNGRVVASARAYAEHGRTRFTVMVPESALRSGYNRVEALLYSGGRARRLDG